jgi:hypothetical protein
MRPTLRVLLALIAIGAAAGPAWAQQDSVQTVAGEEYRAGGMQRLLWGSNYRDLWTRPVRVPVLDPDTFAGGLTPLRSGGDFASNTLHMRGADGRRYVFRSINKDVSKGLGPEFEGTLVEWVVQDQVSASHPAAPSLTHPLMEAAGVLHAPPRMVVMGDRLSLAACRERFAGVLGYIEERADENDPQEDEGDADEEDGDPGDSTGADQADDAAGDPLRESCGAPEPRPVDGPAFAGADVVKGTDAFLDDLEDSPANRLDSRAYLAARLLDIFMGDWDRHEDQWRWAGYDRGGVRVWQPIPRDRDNAFVRHEGLVMSAARRVFVRMVRFEEEYPSLTGLTVQAEPLDRRLLGDLPRAAWDSVVAGLQGRLTDAAIDAAVAALPPEYSQGSRVDMARILRARRNALHEHATQFYERLALNVDIYATDADELAVVDRNADGTLDVTITGAGEDARPFVTYRRRFVPDETDDVRLYMQGGADRVVVRGPGHGVGVRVIGGGGDDVFEDSTRRTGVVFYDHRGDNRFARGPQTRVRTRDWVQPVDTSSITGRRTYRDWGWSISTFSPSADWRRGAGPVLLFGPSMTKYGFRREPFDWKGQANIGWAPLETRFTVEAELEVHPENARHWYEVETYASELENVRFFGFGNATPRTNDSERYDTWLQQVRLAPALVLPVAGDGRLAIGPVFQWTDPEVESGSPLDLEQPIGSDGGYMQLGLRADAELDGRDGGSFPRRGWRLEAGTSGYGGLEEPFGEAHVMGATYLSAGAGPVLALRVGGKRVWGDFPFFESAFLGGGSTLRGHTGQRFAGDAMAFGGAELRMPLVRLNLGLRGTLGVMGLADAGRVWFGGDSPGDWHTAAGGGVFFHAAGQTVFFTVARGERTSTNFGLGMPF